MIADALTYARARMVSFGYTEWTDALNFDNIPRTLLDSVFHIEMGEVSNQSESSDNVHIEVPLSIRFFVNGFATPVEGRDSAIAKADTIIDDFILATNRLNQSGLWNCQFQTLNVLPVDVTNDNVFEVKIDFNLLIIKCNR